MVTKQNTMTETTHELTIREHEVLELISRGYTNNSIASEMSISTNTVKFHLKNIFTKLKARNRIEAINKFQHQ
ncbi:MAG: helix-turn-helix transcriptional regulator [Cyclobacteriaceae bacterium]|nr:helix-turn-helix transcriptional regulator [Cyclobacteriaceae bacterium]